MKLLKTFFESCENSTWALSQIASISLLPRDSDCTTFYPLKDDLVVASPHLGTVQHVLGQSIVPIVANVAGENTLRCLGTGFFISCTGLLITAAHVIIDPIERKYGDVIKLDDQTWDFREIKMGVMLPPNPMLQGSGYIFREIQWATFLGSQTENPIPIPSIELKLTSDTAICKVAPISEKVPHQPLSIVQTGLHGTGMAVGKSATAIGYGSMRDVELTREDNITAGDFHFDLYLSTGTIIEHFSDNQNTKQVSTPGACFSASIILTGGMSGSPIFDDERIYVHGVASKCWEDENGPTDFGYGSMLAHSLVRPIKHFDGKSLLDLHSNDVHGFPKLRLPGG